MNVQEAKAKQLKEFMRSLREGDGWPVEADETLNEANRRIIRVMGEHGDVWLGKINLYGDERHGGHPIMWKWDGGMIYNFDAAFVATEYDEELVRLIRERDDAPYTGTGDDAKRIDVIADRVTKIGFHLFWT